MWIKASAKCLHSTSTLKDSIKYEHPTTHPTLETRHQTRIMSSSSDSNGSVLFPLGVLFNPELHGVLVWSSTRVSDPRLTRVGVFMVLPAQSHLLRHQVAAGRGTHQRGLSFWSVLTSITTATVTQSARVWSEIHIGYYRGTAGYFYEKNK